MDKKERDIFEEVINSLNALKSRVEALEQEVAGLKGLAGNVPDENEVIDIEIDDLDLDSVGLDVEMAPDKVGKKSKLKTFDDFLADFEPKVSVSGKGAAACEETATSELPVEEAFVQSAVEEFVQPEQSLKEEVEEVEETEKVGDAPVGEVGLEEVTLVEESSEETSEEKSEERTEEQFEEQVPVEEEVPVGEKAESAVEENNREVGEVEVEIGEQGTEEEAEEEEEVKPVREEENGKEEETVSEPALFGEVSLFGAVEEPAVKHTRKSRKTVNESAHLGKTVIDVMAEKLAWKHDMPGSKVRDIKSAISLNDRVLFISSLFREDSMLYQDTMHRLNAMKSLDEAVQYLLETFPEWNLESDSVYRFMMAVRRKLR